MESDRKGRDQADAGVSSGAGGLIGAGGLSRPRSAPGSQPLQLESLKGRIKAPRDGAGNDPYNTSGSFDRTRNWARVGKR